MIKSLLKAAAAVVGIPVSVVADAVTLGGVCVGKHRPYTVDAISDLVANLKKATDPNE